MNIIEKLGITPIQEKIVICTTPKYTGFDLSAVREVEQQRNKLLVGHYELITDAINTREQTHGNFRGGPEKYYQEDIKIIEEISEMSWKEIKALI